MATYKINGKHYLLVCPQSVGTSALFLILKVRHTLISIKTQVIYTTIIHTMEYYLSAKKNEIYSQKDLQNILLHINYCILENNSFNIKDWPNTS